MTVRNYPADRSFGRTRRLGLMYLSEALFPSCGSAPSFNFIIQTQLDGPSDHHISREYLENTNPNGASGSAFGGLSQGPVMKKLGRFTL